MCWRQRAGPRQLPNILWQEEVDRAEAFSSRKVKKRKAAEAGTSGYQAKLEESSEEESDGRETEEARVCVPSGIGKCYHAQQAQAGRGDGAGKEA